MLIFSQGNILRKIHRKMGHALSQLSHLATLINHPRVISNREFEHFLRTFEIQGTEEAQFSKNGILIPEEARPISVETPPTPAQAEAQMLMKSLFNHSKTLFGDLVRKRDQKVVQFVLNQPGNGLIILGTAHGPGIRGGLTRACQNGL